MKTLKKIKLDMWKCNHDGIAWSFIHNKAI